MTPDLAPLPLFSYGLSDGVSRLDVQEVHRHVVGLAYSIRGTRGRLSQLWIVKRCPYCTETHRHQARPEAVQGKRTASCHGGKYVVIATGTSGRTA